jgi:hypothetical protein
MKSLLILALAFGLTGCGAIAPFVSASPTAGPTSSPQVIFQTVVVTVLVTAPATETPIPTSTWTPIPTFTLEPTSLTATTGTAGSTQSTGTAATSSAAATPSATLPPDAGGSLFTNLTRSTDRFALRCQPDTLTLGLTTADPNVTEVDLFYRLEDKSSGSITDWTDIGKMTPDHTGNFSFDFQSGMIPSDLRTRQLWFDYQFVGLNSRLQVVGRSSRILQQITFTPDCP